MSQASIVLPETGVVSGLQLAQAMNAALGAVASRQAGDQDPGAIGAWQIWCDTVSKRVKLRNAANSGWIDIGPLDKPMVEMAGAMGFFATQTPPVGWMRANGAAVSIAAYPELAASIYCGDANNPTALFGYRCTNASSPTTSRSTAGQYIVLPDGRGEFLRGWDDARGIDSGRGFGSAQPASSLPLLGVYRSGSTAVLVGPNVNTMADGSQVNPTGDAQGGIGSGPYFSTNLTATGSSAFSSTYGARPRNLALLACIKF